MIECDWNGMIEEVCKYECTIRSFEEFSLMWFSAEITGTTGDDVVDVDIEQAMKPRWLHAHNLKDGYTTQNTSKSCMNVDSI